MVRGALALQGKVMPTNMREMIAWMVKANGKVRVSRFVLNEIMPEPSELHPIDIFSDTLHVINGRQTVHGNRQSHIEQLNLFCSANNFSWREAVECSDGSIWIYECQRAWDSIES